jgi:hypothetical protein
MNLAAALPSRHFKRDKIVFKELTDRSWRSGVVLSVCNTVDCSVNILWHNGRSIHKQEVSVHLIRASTATESTEERRNSQWQELLAYKQTPTVKESEEEKQEFRTRTFMKQRNVN